MLPVAAAAAGSGGVGGGDASTARAAGSVTGAGVAAAAAGVGLPEQLRRLHIVHDLHARNAARIRKELSARELRMQPLDMWTVLKELEPGRAFPPKKCKALFESQRECKPIVAPAAAVSTIGCVMLEDAPDSVMRHFDVLAMKSLLVCLQGGRGHLRLQGLTHVPRRMHGAGAV